MEKLVWNRELLDEVSQATCATPRIAGLGQAASRSTDLSDCQYFQNEFLT